MSYDYTAPQFDENPDDFLIGNVASAAEKDVDTIEKENRFLTVPPGVHVLELVGFFGKPQPVYQKVFVNGALVGFDSFAVGVKFALPSNYKVTISDRFILPPSTPAGLVAYFSGVPEDSKKPGQMSNMAPGIIGNRFSTFINRLGFRWGPGENFPLEAQKLGSWKGRFIKATVDAGFGTYTTKEGVTKPSDNKIKWFSYAVPTDAEIAKAQAGASLPGGRPSGTTAQATTAPVNSAAMLAAVGASDVI